MSRYLELKNVNEDNVLELIHFIDNDSNSYHQFELLCQRNINSKIFPSIENKLTRYDLIQYVVDSRKRYEIYNHPIKLVLKNVDYEYLISILWTNINTESKNILENATHKYLGYGVSDQE